MSKILLHLHLEYCHHSLVTPFDWKQIPQVQLICAVQAQCHHLLVLSISRDLTDSFLSCL